MKLITRKICWVLLFYCSISHAQKYSDSQINFDRDIVLEEFLEQTHVRELTQTEIDKQLSFIRQEYVKIFEQRQKNIENNTGKRIPLPIQNTSCTNMDFTQGTMGWTYHWSNGNYATRPSQDIGASAQYGNTAQSIVDPINNQTRFQVVPANSFDPTLDQAIKPSASAGERVLLLGRRQEVPDGTNGGGQWAGRGQEEVSKSFTVTAQNSALQYGYAIVFERPGHGNPNSFDIYIDVDNTALTGCAVTSFTVDTATQNNGFIASAVNSQDRVRPWATNTVDLLSLPGVQIGSVVTITFRTRDCGAGAHGSYAYVSARCLSTNQVISTSSASGNLCTEEPITFNANVDVFPGATTQWQILSGTNVIATASNVTSITNTFLQAGTYTVNFTMNSPNGGCSLNSSIQAVVTNCCLDCNDLGSDIFNSLEETETCGEYELTIPEEILDCYQVLLNNGQGQVIPITANMLNNNIFTFDFNSNGTFTIGIRLIDLQSGQACFKRRKEVTVFCCEDCDTFGSNILNSLEETKTCGEFEITIPEEMLACYKIEFYDGQGQITTITANMLDNDVFTFDYSTNGTYAFAIVVYDLETGKICYRQSKKVDVLCCPECATLGKDIFLSLEETDTCGKYVITIPDDSLACYKVEVTTETDTVSLTNSELTNGQYFFDFADNGTYTFIIRLFDLQTGDQCYFGKGSIKVDCFPLPVCEWPKTIGTNNPNDIFNYDSEYTSDLSEDSNGNIVALGRARVGADVGGVAISTESYVAKYTPDGCLISVINMPTISFPVQMELRADNSMIILSRENTSASGPENFYLDKYSATGSLLWRVTISLGLHVDYDVLKFLLRQQNGDIFLNLRHWRYTTTVTDASGVVKTFNQSSVLRFNSAGALTWSEEFNVLTAPPGYFLTDPRTIDIDFNETTNEFLVLLYGNKNSSFELVNQNVDIQLGGILNPNSTRRAAVIRFVVNDPLNTISYVSNFNVNLQQVSESNRIAATGTNIYISERRSSGSVHTNYVNIYNQQGTLVQEEVTSFWVDDMESIQNTSDVLLHGSANAGSGYGISKFVGLNQVWSRNEQTLGNLVSTYDVLEHSGGKIYLAGGFTSNVGPFAPHIGGYDGYITRFNENNGIVSTGFRSKMNSQDDKIKKSDYVKRKVSGVPNPFVDQFRVFNNSHVDINFIEIYDMYGVLIRKQNLNQTKDIVMSTVTSGIYLLKVYFENGTIETLQLVKE